MQHESHTTAHSQEHDTHRSSTHEHDSFYTKKRIPNQISTQTAILIGAVIIAISLLFHGALASRGGSNNSNLSFLESFNGRAPGTGDYIEGKSRAKVFFVEYSDTECPFCIAFHNTVSQIRAKYGDKITFVYRHFPLTSIHPDAMPEAIKMTCIGKLKGDEGYYDFMTKLFDYKIEKKVTKIDDTFTADYLAKNNIDKTSFENCTQDPSTKASVEESISDGAQAGVNGTPTSFILIKDGESYQVLKRFEGAAQFNLVAPLIEKAIKLQ